MSGRLHLLPGIPAAVTKCNAEVYKCQTPHFQKSAHTKKGDRGEVYTDPTPFKKNSPRLVVAVN